MSFYSNVNFNFFMGLSSVEVMSLNNVILSVITFIMLVTVLFFFLVGVSSSSYSISSYSNVNLEILWTVLPAGILVSLAVPSLTLLYLMEESASSVLVMKILGHQWYWSYECAGLDLDMVQYGEKSGDALRLLDVDNSLSLPFGGKILGLVTSEDVLHSWALPSLGLKMDAVPSRLNSLNFSSYTPGVVYSECSEICGLNHAKMPIKLEFMSWSQFLRSNY